MYNANRHDSVTFQRRYAKIRDPHARRIRVDLRACQFAAYRARDVFPSFSTARREITLFSHSSRCSTNYVGNTIELRISPRQLPSPVPLRFSPPVTRTISSARFPHYVKYTSFHRVFNKPELISQQKPLLIIAFQVEYLSVEENIFTSNISIYYKTMFDAR